ncbi:MAG TPA: cyclic nucleotide-binding domain-containing protein [Thermoanaerobaculia bacterium]|nr:cyclic nucleotide-binding domain-containing protein [Thermoanaerobaculia bacterium]
MQREFLQNVPLFQGLDEDQLARLESLTSEARYPSNQVLFREGDAVDAFYLVRAGAVTVFRSVKGQPMQILARLEAGGFFGEMGLLNKARRLASARTAGPTTLLKIPKAELLALLADNPGLELKFRAEVIRRHGLNVSALLGLAGQRDVRIRLGVAARIELEDGSCPEVTLENLSLGGVGLSGAPAGWEPGAAVRFGLAPLGEAALLEVFGSVSWREGDTVGIAFDLSRVRDEVLLYRVLRRFLEAKE